MSRQDSGVIDLFAICARPSSSPAGDLRPPDLFSVAPPAVTTDIDENDASISGLFQTKSRAKLALAAAGAALLMVGLVVVGASGGKPKAARASAAQQLPLSGEARPLPAVAVDVPPAALAMPSPLPAPPTTGAPLIEKAPPRPSPPSAMKARASTSGGPKMTKVRSGGVAGR